jgi:hypothetical protein
METVGHRRTWRTLCFINGGCGEEVFAHTNGYGDFVLFDRLGWPWAIHGCYLERFCLQTGPTPDHLEIRASAVPEYREAYEKVPLVVRQGSTRDICRVNAEDHVGEAERAIFGYVQDFIENRAEHQLRALGTVGQEHLRATLGNNRSQITIVTSDFESYTAYADLRNVVVRKKDMVAARMRPIRVLGINRTRAVFLCDEILLVRGAPSS